MALGKLENEQDLFNWLREQITTIMPPGNVQAQIAFAVDAIQFPNVPPPGSVFSFAGVDVPDGYLECDGTPVSRTDYAALFAAVGTTHGVGDGSTTFNLPDLLGRVIAGKGSNVNVSSVGRAGGTIFESGRSPFHLHAIDHTHQHDHTHNVSGTTGGDGPGRTVADDPHTHSQSGGGTTGNNSASITVSQHSHDHTFSDTSGGPSPLSTGSADPLESSFATLPFLTLLAIIKT